MREDEATLRKLRERGEEPVTASKAKELALRLGAYSHIECSAKMARGLKETFHECITAVLEPRIPEKKKDEKKKCNIL